MFSLFEKVKKGVTNFINSSMELETMEDSEQKAMEAGGEPIVRLIETGFSA